MSPEDFDFVNHLKWHVKVGADHLKYAYCSASSDGERRPIPMHRLIMSPEVDQFVDHINGCGLDNRRSNLRNCSPEENSRNRRNNITSKESRFVGVSKNGPGWVASITISSRQFRIGTFPSEDEAARVRDAATRYHFKEFGKLNFPNEDITAESAEALREKYSCKGTGKKTINRPVPPKAIIPKSERKIEADKYHGVSAHSNKPGFQVTLNIRNEDGTAKQYYLGKYKDAVSAALAYDSVSIYFRGKDTRFLNFPELATIPMSPEECLKKGKVARSTSEFKGVWRVNSGSWQATIKVNGKSVHLGAFDTEELAAEAYLSMKEKMIALGLAKVAGGATVEV